MKRFVVGIDGSETSSAALRWVVDEARQHGAAVEAVHAWHDVFVGGEHPMASTMLVPNLYRDAAEALLGAAIEEEDTSGLASPVDPNLVHGSPAAALLEAAKGADLLVVGARGRGGFAGLLLGSVSQQVTLHAPCPVVVIPHAG